RLALIEPVRPAEVARVHLVRAPRPAELLLMALDLVERGEQRPGLLSRTTPLQRPPSVSNARIASIVAVPPRVTRRGGVRFSAIRKPFGRARAAHCFSALTTTSRPPSVWIVQVSASTSRQWQSGGNRARKPASLGAAS